MAYHPWANLLGVQAFPRPSPSGDCACPACCRMKSSMNHLTLILYCFTVRSVPSNQGGYLRLYLLHNFFNCRLTAALNPFFSYLFSGCSLLSIWLTTPNASISLSDGGPLLLGLGGVGGMLGGRFVLALPPPQPMSSLSGMFGSLGLLQATPAGAHWLPARVGDQDWWWWVIAPSVQPVMVFIIHEHATLRGLSPVIGWLMEPSEFPIPFMGWPPLCPRQLQQQGKKGLAQANHQVQAGLRRRHVK